MTDPLLGVNQSFRSAYGDRRAAAANDDPILVVLADDLVLIVGKTRTLVPFSPASFHAAKAISHAPVTLWLRGASPALRALVTRSLDTADDLLKPLLEATLAAMDDPAFDRDVFAKTMGPRLLAAIEHATRLQLEALHARTEELLARLTPEQRAKLHVAVTGDHQARVRSLGMQYFARRLGADRVLYAEGVSDTEAAAALVGAQRLDREMAGAFFGNPRRMERDLLGDAAKAILDAADLAPIR